MHSSWDWSIPAPANTPNGRRHCRRILKTCSMHSIRVTPLSMTKPLIKPLIKPFGITPDWPAPARVKAFITTREGGCSSSPYTSNNFGLHVGDDPKLVEKNRAQLCAQLGLEKTPQWLEQTHGVNVVTAKADGLVRTADGCFSDQPGQACAVMTADC